MVRDHHFPPGSDPALPGAFDATLSRLAEAGASLTPVALPYWQEMVIADTVTMSCQALEYHAGDARERWAEYRPATRSVLAWGALLSGADYVQAQRMRRVAQGALARLFEDIDVIVCPTASVAAPPLEEPLSGGTGVFGLFEHVHTGYWDSVGNPVLALPMGFNAAGIAASDDEVAELAARYPVVRAAVDALCAPAAARYADPALRFRADAHITDWAAYDPASRTEA